jgi:hypothetical protein
MGRLMFAILVLLTMANDFAGVIDKREARVSQVTPPSP